MMPLAGAFAKTYHGPEHTLFPLRLMWCDACQAMQTDTSVPPDLLFRDYSYRSSVAQPLVLHFQELADKISALYDPALVVDVGCNDGVLVSPLRQHGIKVVGIDPSDIAREASQSQEWSLVNSYLTGEVAREVVDAHGYADVVVASNVLAHTDDLHALCDGVKGLLGSSGTFICEVHYLGDLLAGRQFDTVYHEHTMYYSVRALSRLFAMHHLYINRVERIGTHAGSIRVTASPSRMSALAYTFREPAGILDPMQFAEQAMHARDVIRQMVYSLSRTDRIWAYGASGRCTILLNWCELAAPLVDTVVDDSPRRIGRLVPGVRTPIKSSEELARGTCGVLLVTAWNYFDALRARHPEYRGRWIKPLPELTVV